MAEQLLLRQLVARRPVAADANADKTGAAALSLRLIYRMHDAFADAIKVTACFAQTFNLSMASCIECFCSRSRRLLE